MQYPRISIVTASYNQGKYLEQTILSIINQKYPNLEYIIIDGGSTDNSVDIIKKYESSLTYWISEKDNGQSDAINKGLVKCTGEIFNWLNSDDYLEEGSLFKIADAYLNNPDKKVFCFSLSHLEDDKKMPFDAINNASDELQCFCDPVINQQSTFYSMDAIKAFGGVNEFLHYTMDYEWWLKFMFLYGSKNIFTANEKISVYRLHKEAKTVASGELFAHDIATILNSILLHYKLIVFSDLLKARFNIIPNYIYRGVFTLDKKNLVERMVVYFLLKWTRGIYNRQDYLFAKKMLKDIDFNKYLLSDKEKNWLEQIKSNSSGSNWFIHRILKRLTTS